MRRQKSRCQQHFDFFFRCRFMDVAGSHPKIRHLPQNCLAEMEITALYVYPRKCPLQCRDQGGLKIANYCLWL
ncbi:hypothetical protein T12_16101, partial [Trichinella patagoniensis]